MLIRVQVDAGAKKDSIRKVSEDSYHVSVREMAQQNQANKKLVMLVAGHLGVSPKQVRIRTGHHRPKKTLQIG